MPIVVSDCCSAGVYAPTDDWAICLDCKEHCDPVLEVEGGFSEETGATGAHELLARGAQFTALFAADDEMAIGAISVLNAAGMRVPQDVAVVGFDDIATARYIQPPLTTVRAPTEQVGREAVRLLLAAISGAQPPTQTVLLPVELVIRQSCGS